MTRAFSVFLSLKGSQYDFREKLFATLNMPKGIAMAVVAFFFTGLDIPAVNNMLDYMLALMVFSLILSTIVTRMSEFFIEVNIQEAKEEEESQSEEESQQQQPRSQPTSA